MSSTRRWTSRAAIAAVPALLLSVAVTSVAPSAGASVSRAAGLPVAMAAIVAAAPATSDPVLAAAEAEEPLAGLEEKVRRLMERGIVPGLSMAVIRDGEIVWTGAFGIRNTATGELVDAETMFEAASLTKPVVAYAALKMMDRGELDLDTPLMTYRPEDRFPDRDRYEKLTARHVLTHTTGLPNWGVDFEADPGERFGYSGEGFAYLGRAMEEIDGRSLQELVRAEVFRPLGMRRSSLVSNDQHRANGASGHGRHGLPHGQRFPETANAGASLLTTATDYARFMIAFAEGQGLESTTIESAFQPHVRALEWESAQPTEHIHWGLGWGLQSTDTGLALWHWGDNEDVKSYAALDLATRLGVVYFANSENGLTIAEDLVALVIRDHQWALDWLGEPKYDQPDRVLLMALESAYAESGIEIGRLRLSRAVEESPELLNDDLLGQAAGYLRSRDLTPEALDVVNVMIEMYPQSSDAYAGRGELLMELEQFTPSLADLSESLRLDPDREDVKRTMEWVRELVVSEDDPITLPVETLKTYVGDYGPRHVRLRDGGLYYLRDGRAEYALMPLDEQTFRLEGLARFRMRFELGADGRASKIIGIYLAGHQDESVRDE